MYFSPMYPNPVVIILPLLAWIVVEVIFGCACSSLAGIKGYKGYFAVGFLFGIFGLIYVAGLPVSDTKEEEKYIYLARRIAHELQNATDEKKLS